MSIKLIYGDFDDKANAQIELLERQKRGIEKKIAEISLSKKWEKWKSAAANTRVSKGYYVGEGRIIHIDRKTMSVTIKWDKASFGTVEYKIEEAFSVINIVL